MGVNFWLMLPFYIPGKHEKTKGFVVFSGALKSKQWSEKDYDKVERNHPECCRKFENKNVR